MCMYLTACTRPQADIYIHKYETDAKTITQRRSSGHPKHEYPVTVLPVVVLQYPPAQTRRGQVTKRCYGEYSTYFLTQGLFMSNKTDTYTRVHSPLGKVCNILMCVHALTCSPDTHSLTQSQMHTHTQP